MYCILERVQIDSNLITQNFEQDYLLRNAPMNMEHTPKMMQLMADTGLTRRQIMHYFHNCIRRGVRSLEAMESAAEQKRAQSKRNREEEPDQEFKVTGKTKKRLGL